MRRCHTTTGRSPDSSGRSWPFLGVWLIINGFAYLAKSFTGLLSAQYENKVTNFAFLRCSERMAFMLWLLIMGAKVQPSTAPAS